MASIGFRSGKERIPAIFFAMDAIAVEFFFPGNFFAAFDRRHDFRWKRKVIDYAFFVLKVHFERKRSTMKDRETGILKKS